MTNLFTVGPFELFVLPARTRFPFRYGIASMTDVPHLFARTRVEAGGRSHVGVTAEGLPPKWFTKDPDTTFEQDLPAMIDAIRHAAQVAEIVGRQPHSFFDLWRAVSDEQASWGAKRNVAPLLAGLGVSIVERAVLDGLCRTLDRPVHRLVADNWLALRLAEIYPELESAAPEDLLPPLPVSSCFVRHTIGLGDPLSDGDLGPQDRVGDGLPQTLAASIRAYGLRYFKLKLAGKAREDSIRLREVVRMLAADTRDGFWLTVDGNENFEDFSAFRDFWEQIHCDSTLADVPRRTLAVEQPVHRSRALDDSARAALTAWHDRPPVIVDESDAALGDVPRALECGYAGSSFKSCKGIVKGIANACLLAYRRSRDRDGMLTGEDLCTLGPIALQQDLAMMALLGITHVERNGHHYYRGLSMLPRDWQDRALENHPDLYVDDPIGFARVRIREGALDIRSVNAAAFGVRPVLDVSRFAALENSGANVLKF